MIGLMRLLVVTLIIIGLSFTYTVLFGGPFAPYYDLLLRWING